MFGLDELLQAWRGNHEREFKLKIQYRRLVMLTIRIPVTVLERHVFPNIGDGALTLTVQKKRNLSETAVMEWAR